LATFPTRPPSLLAATPVAAAAFEISSAAVAAFTGDAVSVVPAMAGSRDDDDDAIDINRRAPGDDDDDDDCRADTAKPGLLFPDLDDVVFFIVNLFLPFLRLPSLMELPLEMVWTMTSPVKVVAAAVAIGSTGMMEGCRVDGGDDDVAAMGEVLLEGLTPVT